MWRCQSFSKRRNSLVTYTIALVYYDYEYIILFYLHVCIILLIIIVQSIGLQTQCDIKDSSENVIVFPSIWTSSVKGRRTILLCCDTMQIIIHYNHFRRCTPEKSAIEQQYDKTTQNRKENLLRGMSASGRICIEQNIIYLLYAVHRAKRGGHGRQRRLGVKGREIMQYIL